MTMRRDFIGKAAGAMAGVVFCGCGLLHPPGAHAQAPYAAAKSWSTAAASSYQVVPTGRQPKT